MDPKQQRGTPFTQTATGATATATQTGVSGTVIYVTDVAGSSDKAGSLILIKDGSTVVWQMQVATTAAGINAFSHQFKTPISIAGTLTVVVDGTTKACSNVQGYVL